MCLGGGPKLAGSCNDDKGREVRYSAGMEDLVSLPFPNHPAT